MMNLKSSILAKFSHKKIYNNLKGLWESEKHEKKEWGREDERKVRGDVNVAYFSTVWFVGLDVNPTVGIPEAESAILAAAQAVVAISVEPHGQHRSFVPLQHTRLIHWQLGPTLHLSPCQCSQFNSSRRSTTSISVCTRTSTELTATPEQGQSGQN